MLLPQVNFGYCSDYDYFCLVRIKLFGGSRALILEANVVVK